MNDLERRLEEMFMSDSRGRRVRKVSVPSRRPSAFRALAYIGGIAVLALALIGTLALVRDQQNNPGASPTASLPAAANTPGPSGTSGASGNPSTTPSGGAVRPDNTHGIITFQNIRTEADPRDLQQPPQFVRNGRSDFSVAVSPDGTRVAMIRTGETGQQLVTFTTARPNDVTIAAIDFSTTGEVASELVWAGDSSEYVVFSVDKRAGATITSSYSALRSYDIAAKKQSEIARITSGLHLVPLAWRFDTHVGGAIEIDAFTGRVASYDVIRDNSLTDRTPTPNLRGGDVQSGPFKTQFSASRDGNRIVAVFAPAVRWWPVDQPGAAKELLADSKGRAEYAEFRPGTGELGVRVLAATVGQGVPPPGHFEIWSLSGQQRVVSPTAGFSRWRVDGTAALDGTNLVDPDSGAVTPLPGATKVVDVVRFTEPVAAPTATAPVAVTSPLGPVSPTAQATIDGRTFRIADAYLWRDFMPISPPDGKPLAASLKIQVDSGAFPVDVTVDRIWVYGPTVWEPALFEVRRSPDAGTPADQIEVFANGGPKWDPGSEVSVDVRLISGGTTRILRVTEVTIQKTS